ncbi:MAG: hypothetical protein LCI00_07520 [Chloroflexi bacterium]|nr:hypothetical protein [Chloroflexota bacterium]MCC6894627.1 hypothetical protein [Anaerolineae bacterium]
MKPRLAILFLALTALFTLPVLAQDSSGGLATISYNGITFSYDPALGAVLPRTYEAVPAAADQMMDTYWPAHTSFIFIPAHEGETLSSPDFYPQLTIYKTDDISNYNDDFYTYQLQTLSGLLEGGGAGDFSDYETVPSDDRNVTLPHLPAIPAGQVLRAQAEYLPMTDGNGIRYLTAYAFDVSPVTDDQIIYTYQGATHLFSGNGTSYYVALTYPVTTGVLPGEIPSDFDYNAFSDNYYDEMNATIQTINSADPNTFSPSIAALDALVQSIQFEG